MAKKIPPRTGNPGSFIKPKRHLFDRFASEILPFVEDGDPHDLLEPEYIAAKLRVSDEWLDAGRANKFGPPFVRLSSSVIRYPRGKFIQYLKSRSEIPDHGKVRTAPNRGVPGRPKKKADVKPAAATKPTKPSKLEAAE
jgi:hypothetical protein